MNQFIKSHALGNDYIFMREEDLTFSLSAKNIQSICDRHFGIGSDGLLVKVQSKRADFGLRIFNPDGSEAKKSGNGIRIFAHCLYQHEKNCPSSFSIETLGGVVRAQINLESDSKTVKDITVEMGQGSVLFNGILEVNQRKLSVVSLSIGNPHCVVFDFDTTRDDFKFWGEKIESHEFFPDRTNVQFVKVISPNLIQAWIWERGAGHTLASGSSACAVALACWERGLTTQQVAVQMEGGSLAIDIGRDRSVLMTGTAEEIYVGTLTKRVNS